jgi:hypothetical protein
MYLSDRPSACSGSHDLDARGERRRGACLCVGGIVVLMLTTGIATADSEYTRISTVNGPLHVWKPAGYDPDTAGIVIYVHGYYVNVDRAWRDHHLAAQFAESRLNALFVACEAPRGPKHVVSWPSLALLLATLERELDEPRRSARVVAIAHSGAHRTLSFWLTNERLATIALLDAHYGEMPQVRSWITGSEERRLINVGNLTREWADQLHASLPESLVFEEFPDADTGQLPGAHDAQIVYVRSHVDHMQLVTGGIALPMILRALRIPMVRDAERTTPIRHAR